MDTALRVLVYGLLAAMSPLALAATLVVLRSRRPRLNGFIYATAFLLGETFVVVVVLAAGSIGTPGDNSRDTFVSLLELGLGVLLLATALRVRRGAALREGESSGRTRAVLARLAHLTSTAAFSAGLLLGIGGPKRLTISIVTAATISAGGLSAPEQVGLVAFYVVVAALLVWVPVATYIVAGDRARGWMTAAEEWLTENQRAVTAVSLVVFGVVLVSDALVQLL